MKHLTWIVLVILLSTSAVAQPLASIYHPVQQRNVAIENWEYQEIVSYFDNARFRHFNDLERVCETLEYWWHKSPASCRQTQMPLLVRPVTTRAYAQFEILPVERVPADPRGPRLIVDPIYPPYSPVYSPWEWPWQ